MKNKYQEAYEEFIKSLKYIDELVDSLTIEQRKSLGATTWSIQGVLGRYINEEKDFIKELIDKETPMKPMLKENDVWQSSMYCKNCESFVGTKHLEYTHQNYCYNCRQRIDWRGKDNEINKCCS